MIIDDSRSSKKHAMSHFSAAVAEGSLFDEEIKKRDRRLIAENRGQMF
jgi:hypothetical protein